MKNNVIDKTRLKQFRAQAKEMQLIAETINAMRETIGAKVSGMDGTGRSQGDGTATERTVEKLLSLENKYLGKLREYADERDVIERALGVLDPNERALIRLYYFDLHNWEEVAKLMNYSYQHIHRIHAAALEKLKQS